MSKYTEKFKDPRWQKRRLLILERDEWTCQYCGEKEETLNVHHLWYEKGKDPWEYPDECLITLCEGCHELDHESRANEEQNLLRELKIKKFSSSDLSNLLISLHFIDYNFPIKDFIKLFDWLSKDRLKLELLISFFWGMEKRRKYLAKNEPGWSDIPTKKLGKK